MGRKKEMCNYIGIYNGGFCGAWDFYTNGKEVFLKHEKDKSINRCRNLHLEKFLSEFDILEMLFIMD